MKRIQHASLLLVLAGVAAATLPACGDSGQTCGEGTVASGDTCVPDNPIECGPGTVEQAGECVPESELECGAGTTEVDGQCVPDGSVICEQGTVFDEDTGTCVLDPSACAAGTVLVGDECVPEDDTLPDLADHTEGAEPNGPGDEGIAGQFAAPATGSNVTFYGCVDPAIEGGDFDTWVVTTTGPTVVDLTVDGIGGLVAGFAFVDGNGNPLLASWQRLGLNLTGDTASRQVYLPTAGAWALFVTDGRTLFFGEAAGNADSCYFGTLTTAPLPTATALTVPQTAATDDGDVKVYAFDATATADILDLTANTDSGAMSSAFVLERDGALVGAYAADGTTPPFATVGGLDTTGDTVTIIWDAEYNYAVAPQAFTLDSLHIAAQPLPTDGSTLTVTKRNGATPAAAYADLNYLYFDVASPSILHWNLTSSVNVDMVIVRRDVFTPAGNFDTFASINAFGSTGVATFQGQFTRFLTPGRYYFVTQDPAGTAGDTFTITSTLTTMTTTPVTYGTPVTGVALPTQGSGFHTLDLTTPTWVQFGGTGTDWGAAQVRIEAYDLAGQGWMTTTAGNYAPVFAANQLATGAAPFGRVMAGDTRDYLIRVTSSAAVGAAPTYDLAIGDRPHVDLGTLAVGTPITRANLDEIAATTGIARFLVRGTAGNEVSVVADPSDAAADVRLRRYNADESIATTINAGGAGATETLNSGFLAAPGNWVAFAVENIGGVTTNLDPLTLTASAPTPFTITSGTLAFDDACVGGTTVATGQDDEYHAITLPFAFSVYGGAPTTDAVIAANGFLKLGAGNPTCSFGCFSNTAIPTALDPVNFIAPHWDDLANITLCTEHDAGAGTFTVQWVGTIYNSSTAVAFQTVLHDGGVIDLIWGAGHQTTGSTASIGVENLSGLFGQQIGFNQAVIAAGTSRTLTP